MVGVVVVIVGVGVVVVIVVVVGSKNVIGIFAIFRCPAEPGHL